MERSSSTTCTAGAVLFAALASNCGIAAQRIVSPAHAASAEGNTANTFPWNFAGRYQQVHGDLRGAALAISGLEFRRDGLQPGGMAGRRLDCEAWASEAPYTTFAPVFDRNHGAGKQHVMARRLIDLPLLTTQPTPPEPFLVALPFDGPFAYTGAQDLVWELRIHANSGTALSYHCDAYTGVADSDVGSGFSTRTGRGCTANGETQPMHAGAALRTFRGASQVTASLWAEHAPRSQPSVLLLGTQAIDVPIPGLCASLRAGGTVIEIPGATGADGTHFVQVALPFYAQLAGVTAVHQVLTFDPARLGQLQVAVSDLATWTIPAMPAPGGAVKVARLWFAGTADGPAGTMDAANYSLVTGFSR